MSTLSESLNKANEDLKNKGGVDYDTTHLQLKSLTQSENNFIANLANISSLLKTNHQYFWVGFYLVEESSQQLVLGPFQGTLACTRIPIGRGVCGTAWKNQESLFVPNVHEFPGHIACDSRSECEIVIVLKNSETQKIWGVLDIDSSAVGGLKNEDFQALKLIGETISKLGK
ncbi:MAG: GAF domain-containing protein [Bacteriovoracaceae bacterium]|nr:GAF domain-containing protein [Bacteriovoracaceae bacterium]